MTNPFSIASHIEPENPEQQDDSHVIDEALSVDNTDTETSLLPLKVRQAIKVLHNDGVLYAEEKEDLFHAISTYQSAAQAVLDNLGIHIYISKDDGIAYIDSPPDQQDIHDTELLDTERVTTVLKQSKPLPLFASLVLIQLRKYYHEKENEGNDNIYIDHDTIESLMSAFSKLNTSSRQSGRDINGAMKIFSSHKIVRLENKGNERYLIRPLIKYIITLAHMDEMISDYINMAKEHGISITKDIMDSIPSHIQTDLFGDMDENNENGKAKG